MFMGPMDGFPDFRDTGIEGMRRFVERIWDLYTGDKNVVLKGEEDNYQIMVKMHQTIKKVTKDIESFKYNTAISAIMDFVNVSAPAIIRIEIMRRLEVIILLVLLRDAMLVSVGII